MADAHGVTSTFGLTTPTNGFTSESRRGRKQGKAVVRDELGEFVKMRAKKLIEEDVTIRGKGDPAFAGVTSGEFVAGAVKVISAESTEVAEGEYPDFEITGKAFSTAA
ncbi:MAG: hypothetical protein QM496_01940 [Verrucomicrobiota bacterium]